MAKHEFGIFDTEPVPGTRYDEYSPEKYDCIEIQDDYIEPMLEELNVLETYIHTLSCSGKGLAYYGITLIPPSSLPKFKKVIDSTGVSELRILSKKIDEAIRKYKFMIHYGI
jgi:hypothetical protein